MQLKELILRVGKYYVEGSKEQKITVGQIMMGEIKIEEDGGKQWNKTN